MLSYQDGGVALYAEEVFRTCVEKPIEDLDPFDADAVDRVHALLATAADAVLGDGGFVHLPPHLIALLGVQDGGPVSITPDPQRLRVDAPR